MIKTQTMSKNYYNEKFETFLNDFNEVGYVDYISYPIVRVSGLPKAKPGEVLMFENGTIGQVMALSRDYVEVLLFSKNNATIGLKVARTNSVLQVPVGPTVLGHAITPLGHSIYEYNPLVKEVDFMPIDVEALGIDSRERITQPLETGVALVDLLIPLGKGQRELIIGDRKTGKTEFLLQAMLSHAKGNEICIYAGIGKRKSDIKQVEDFLVKNGVVDSTVIVASASSDPPGMIFITPYSAMTIADYFRRLGRDVLLILDDLTTHAKFYREISLLGGRFPGRQSYPGDIFYTHSRLLERAGNFKSENGVHSITCLPVAETVEGDISGYIQTNLMSITDGHIYFDQDLFANGRRPAINYFLSVTRVGRQTQTQLRWGINRELNSFLVLLEKTQSFVHFGAEMNEGIKNTLAMGDRVLAFFDQPMGKVVPLNLQMVIFSLIWVGSFNKDNVEKVKFAVQLGLEKYRSDKKFKDTVDLLISSAKDFNDLLNKALVKQKEFMGVLH